MDSFVIYISPQLINKGVIFLLNSLPDEYKDKILVISTGRTTLADNKIIEETVKKLKVNYKYFGMVEKRQLPTFYSAADLICLLSQFDEGWGLHLAEGMAYGKPVIVSDVFLETGVASCERNLIFKRGDYIALANIILQLYHNF